MIAKAIIKPRRWTIVVEDLSDGDIHMFLDTLSTVGRNAAECYTNDQAQQCRDLVKAIEGALN